jgi:hypothetical protein
LIIAVVNSGDDGPTATQPDAVPTEPGTPPEQSPQEEPPPAVGEPVRDGMFEFTINNMECGRTQVGTDPLAATAQGEFCLVTMDVRNIGDESRTFDTISQKASTGTGATYDADSEAALYANENNTGFLTGINPGNEVEGVVVFDVPPGTQLTTIELHDSLLSQGVQAPLR